MRIAERGFALLAVLWVLTAVFAVAGVGMGVARLGAMTTRNRVLLARAAWAREACVEILLARWAGQAGVREVPRVDLGRGTWCHATLEDPGARVNLNTADRATLERLLPPWLVDSVLVRRPLAHEGQLRAFTSDSGLVAGVLPFVTTRGPGTVNLNAAPAPVLRALGLADEAVAVVLAHQSVGDLSSLDAMLGALTPASRVALVARYADLVRTTTFAAAQLVATVEGGVGGTPLVARATLTLVPLPERLAVIRRETE